ncbi:hypothetical protein [Variovorax paradoxus]|uniref:hypothetical protein n=1 Tax=Variovorax paradoxus TaxID=34073 RepID=UPI003D64A0A0
MYDDLRCEFPLPAEGANALSYQTKDTPAQFCEQYVIREDGTLWGEEYDTEGQSDRDAEDMMRLIGCATRVNRRPVQVTDFTGKLRFYTFEKDSFDDRDPGAWVEWSSYFVGGKLKEVHLISDTRAARAEAMAGLPPDNRTREAKLNAVFTPPARRL